MVSQESLQGGFNWLKDGEVLSYCVDEHMFAKHIKLMLLKEGNQKWPMCAKVL